MNNINNKDLIREYIINEILKNTIYIGFINTRDKKQKELNE